MVCLSMPQARQLMAYRSREGFFTFTAPVFFFFIFGLSPEGERDREGVEAAWETEVDGSLLTEKKVAEGHFSLVAEGHFSLIVSDYRCHVCLVPVKYEVHPKSN